MNDNRPPLIECKHEIVPCHDDIYPGPPLRIWQYERERWFIDGVEVSQEAGSAAAAEAAKRQVTP